MEFHSAEGTRVKRQRAEHAIQLALQSRWPEAVAANRTIISLFPSDVDAYNRLGKALMEMGEHEDARRAYEKALELEPGNAIARKNLERVDARKGPGSARKDSCANLDPVLFIAQTGKTGITHVKGVPRAVQAHLTAGDPLIVKPRGVTVTVETSTGEPLGEVEPKLGLRLARLMNGGNQYEAAVAGLSNGDVRVIIREIFQHPSQQGNVSFPAAGGETFRSYVKERLLRHDFEEDEAPEGPEESEEWEPEVVVSEGDISLQDYQEAVEGENDDDGEEEFEE